MSKLKLAIAATILLCCLAFYAGIDLLLGPYWDAEALFNRNSDAIKGALVYRDAHGTYPQDVAFAPVDGHLPRYQRSGDGLSAEIILIRGYSVRLSPDGQLQWYKPGESAPPPN